MPWLRAAAEGETFLLSVYVKAGAKRNAVTSIGDEAISLQIQAPPTKGEANSMVIEFLSELLVLPRRNFLLKSGLRSREKVLQVKAPNLTADDLLLAFQQQLPR